MKSVFPNFSRCLLLAGIFLFMSLRAFSLDSKEELAAYMDGLIHSHMKEYRAASGVAVIIRDDELIFRKAYGYEHLASAKPADAGSTLYRLGSVSKLFTWIAVLQQVERGHLDLDADINVYLQEFSIPETFDEPVTLRSLMSHTPGFEDILLKIFIREGESSPTLEEIFRKQMPRRVRPPMKEASYSNHGTGLAQYIVEVVSGKRFETYVEENILSPLGMNHTTFRQPLPGHLKGSMATGYSYQDGVFREKGFEVVPMTGAGGASATADDMAIFLRALLNHTAHDTISLLDSASFAIMREPAIQHANFMNPALHGFIDMSPAHVRIIGHGGNTFLFHSMLALFPEHNTGIFMSFSGEQAAPICNLILQHIVKMYFPASQTDTTLTKLEDDYLRGFAGTYIPNRRPHSDILKIIGLISAVEISVEGEKLRFTDPYGEVHIMQAADSTTFHVEDKNIYAGFERAPGEKAEKFYISDFPIIAWERATGLYNINLHVLIFLATLAVSLYILLVWPWLYFARKRYDKKNRMRNTLPLFPKAAAWMASLLIFLFYIVLLLSTEGNEIVFGIPSSIRAGLILPLAAIPFVLLMVVNNIYIWNTPNLKRLSRIFYLMATIVLICGILQLHFFNLLGWRF